MKLSKRIAAAFIAMCMLLVSLPAFAASVFVGNNNDLILPTDGTSIAVTFVQTGHANKMLGLVINSASAEALGINKDNITSRIASTAGTAYDGMLISGTFEINRDHYHKDLSTEAAKVMHYGEVTHFDFENLEVEAIRKTSSGLIVFDFKPQSYMDAIVPGTVKKLNPEALNREATEEGIIQLEETDFVTLTTEEEKALTGTDSRVTDGSAHYDFTASGGAGYNVKNLAVKAGADYKAAEVIDTGVFPAGTIFVSSNKINSNGASLNSDWGYQAFKQQSAKPEGTYVAQESGDYVVYALKTGYDKGSNRYAKAVVNEANLNFTQANMPSATVSKKNFYWQKDVNGNVITLSKGSLINISIDASPSFARIAGLALVPVSGAAAVDANVPAWQIKDTEGCITVTQYQLDALHDHTAIDFVAPPAITRTINVNGADYEVSSDDAETVVPASIVDFDSVPIAGVTVLDALVKAGIVTDVDYLKKVAIKLNGVYVYEPAKFIVSEDDVITTTEITAVDATNFVPVRMSDVVSLIGGSDGGIKFCMSTTGGLKTSAISFMHNGSDYVDDALKDAKLVGYLEVNEAITKTYENGELKGTTVTIPVGGRAYVTNGYFSGKVLRAEGTTTGVQAYGLSFANKGTVPLHVTLPDGTVTQHPSHIQQEGYNFANMYVTNSNTTNKVDARYIETTGKWQLFTDGGVFLCVVKYTVDENGKLAAVVSQTPEYLLVNKPLSVELKANERAMVWGYAPYAGAGTGGTTMVPLTGILANPAN